MLQAAAQPGLRSLSLRLRPGLGIQPACGTLESRPRNPRHGTGAKLSTPHSESARPGPASVLLVHSRQSLLNWSTSEVSGLTSPCSWPTSESRPVKRRGNRKSASTTSRTDRRGMAANQPESPALIDSHGGRDCGLPLSGSSRRCGSLRRGLVCAPVPEARPGAAAGVGSPNWPVVGGVGLLLLLLCLQHHPRRFRLLLLFSVSSASFKFSPARQKNEWVRKKAFLRLKFGIERRLFMV